LLIAIKIEHLILDEPPISGMHFEREYDTCPNHNPKRERKPKVSASRLSNAGGEGAN